MPAWGMNQLREAWDMRGGHVRRIFFKIKKYRSGSCINSETNEEKKNEWESEIKQLGSLSTQLRQWEWALS